MHLEIVILNQCERELKEFPPLVVEDFLDAISRLRNGINLSMPLSRSLSDIYKSLHELRFKDKSGIYRAFYIIKKNDAIYVIHAYQKKTQKIPKQNLEIIKQRLRTIA
jgi:phage-related protein